MSIYDHIKESLIKQNKILQVDYLGQKIIENFRDNFQEWQHINPVTQKQKKLWEYLQKEDLHQQKYFRFKKSLNHKHFGLDLPQEYKHSTIFNPSQDDDLVYSPRKMISSVLGNSTMDTSGGNFITGIDTIKQGKRKIQSRASTSFNQRSNEKQRKSFKQKKITSYKRQKNLSRYWPLEDNQSFTFKQKNSMNLIHSRKPKQDRSIFNQSVNRSIKRSFDTIKCRPLSQQMQRHTDQVKNLVQKTINPQVHKQNIRHTLRSLTEKHRITERKVKKQRESILDTITNKEELMRFLRQSRSIDPKRKGIFTIQDLTQFEKFNLSFPKYMKLKSLKKINNYAYQNKVKQKAGNLQKFQNFILQQFGIQSDNKRKLQKIFEQIVWQCGRSQRRKQAQRR